MDSEDLDQIAESLREAIAGSPEHPREAVLDFGWRDLLLDDESAAVSILFRLSGELLVPGSFLDDVILNATGIDDPGASALLLPRAGQLRPTSRLGGGAVVADGLAQTGPTELLVPCVDASGQVALVLCGASAAPDDGDALDPRAGWRPVRRELPVVRIVADDAEDLWAGMRAAGQRALAHELVGVATRMLEMTVEHVMVRHQFGQPLGRFQAVKHQLADVRLWLEAAELSAATAWEQPDLVSAALAKAAALRASRVARAACQQLLGGMGFTWEHEFHHYLRRALTIEPLLGDQRALHTWLGGELRRGAVDRGLVAL